MAIQHIVEVGKPPMPATNNTNVNVVPNNDNDSTATQLTTTAETQGVSAVEEPRGREQRRLATMKKLTYAAADLARARGFHSVTLREVGDLAGLSRGIVNYHFGTRDSLCKAAYLMLTGEPAPEWADDFTLQREYDRWELTREWQTSGRLAYRD